MSDAMSKASRRFRCALLGMIVLGCGGDSSTAPSELDRLEIVYSYGPEGAFADLQLMSADGLIVRSLLVLPGSEVGPEWSPDGRRLAFQYYAPNVTQSAIMIAQADGSGVRTLVPAGLAFYPRWSPDGQWIAFYTRLNETNGIALIRTDGSGLHLLSSQTNNSGGPLAWSVNDRIAFVRADGIWSVRGDGTEPTRITTGSTDSDPRWSPDGTRLLFTRTYEIAPANYRNELLVANADGSSARVLLRGEIVQSPTWSPDGQWILYSRPDLSTGNALRCIFEKIPSAGGTPAILTPAFGRGACAGASWRTIADG
jgi:TolB protein